MVMSLPDDISITLKGVGTVEIINAGIAQQIVDTVKSVCDQNINFIDSSGMIIASTDPQRINTFHEIGYQAAMTATTIEVFDDESYFGTKKGINIPVMYHDRLIAVIGITGEVGKVRRYAFLAQKITNIILRERELEALGTQKKNRQNYVIRSLISSERIEKNYLSETLAENGLCENSICRVVVVQLNERYNPNNLFMIQSAITQTFLRMDLTFFRYSYPNEYILIARSDKVEQKMDALKKLASEYDTVLKIGVGSAVRISQSSLSYQNAQMALECQKKCGTVMLYDKLDYELLLGNVNAHNRESYIEKVLKGLSGEEIALLECYYEEEMSLKATSERLYIHKNSLQYKLNSIREQTGYDPRKFRDAVVLYSAIKLLRTVQHMNKTLD